MDGQYLDYLILFILTMLVSALINYRFELMGSLRAVYWMVLQFFLCVSLNNGIEKRKHCENWFCLANIFSTIMLLGVIQSIWQYCVGYGEYVTFFSDGIKVFFRQGFLENRLFGIFIDPNFAAICSLITIVVSIWGLFKYKNNKIVKSIYLLNILIQYVYMILSGSRIAMLAFYCVLGLSSGLLALRKYCDSWKKLKSIGVFVLFFCISACALSGINYLAKRMLSYLPGLFSFVSLNNIENHSADLERRDVRLDNISNNRFLIWEIFFNLWKKYPLLGVGPENRLIALSLSFKDNLVLKNKHTTHAGWLTVLTDTGIVGFIFIFIWLFLTMKEVIKVIFYSYQNKEDCFGIMYTLLMIVVIIIVADLMNQIIFFRKIILTFIFWITYGYLLYLVRNSKYFVYNESFIGLWLKKIFKVGNYAQGKVNV